MLEDPGTFIAFHGFSCSESNKSGEEDFLKVEEGIEIPPYATDATVFLNGWKVQYLSDDHNVAGVITLIRNIRLEGRSLKWQAGGAFSDDNFDDAYRWCYHYTVIAWNAAAINLVLDQKDDCGARDPRQTNHFGAFNEGTTTALASFRTFLFNPNFASSKTVAILPRGFGFGWECDDDHNLLQIGYNMDHSEIFVENAKKYRKAGLVVAPVQTPPPLPPNSSRVDSGFVSWESSAIFKDNDAVRIFAFGEVVSGLGGGDVGVVQPPFSILPKEDHEGILSSCVSGPGPGVRTEAFEIDNIPYEYAIPMLTGWELAYDCDDENVAEAGVRIDKWDYDRGIGKLRYTLSSTLRDDDSKPDFTHSHKITVLGLKPVARGKTPSQRVPDLIPVSPLGTDPSAFCRIEAEGRLLRVSVKNQGNENAGASKTTVFFPGVQVTVDTPSIPAGGSIDLLFKIPSGCFSPDCAFKISVDAGNQVDESNHEGNNSANGGCIG
jgi:hypothetical protein